MLKAHAPVRVVHTIGGRARNLRIMAFVNGDAPHAFAFSAGVTALVFRAVSPTESNVHTVSYQQKQEQISQHGVFLGVNLQPATEFNRVAAEQQGDFGRDKIFGAPLFPKQRSHALAQQAVDNAEKWQSCFLKERKGGKISVGEQVSEKKVARREELELANDKPMGHRWV